MNEILPYNNFIISWNINSIKAKLQYLQLLLQDMQPFALCLQETKLKSENSIVKKL